MIGSLVLYHNLGHKTQEENGGASHRYSLLGLNILGDNYSSVSFA